MWSRRILISCLLVMVLPSVARAQAIRIDVQDVDLREALLWLAAEENVDLVFAERYLEGRTTTCLYEGDRLEEALACLLRGSGLRAERVRRRQYVLASAPAEESGNGASEPSIPRADLLGFVADAERGEVLPGAHVYLPDLKLGTTTNDAGYFALPALPEGLYQVRISYLGYQPVDTLLYAGAAAADVSLQPAAYQPGEVVVEADRVEVGAEPGMTLVPVQELERLPSFPGEPDLFQALQWLPGVRKSGEVNGGLIVRGGEPDQNLYLLDGAPVYHPWHAFSLISTFQTETFKSIRLYQGAFPAEHGGRLSSVLDAEMKDGHRESPRSMVALSLLSGRFLVESPLTDHVSFMVSGRRSYLDKLIGREHPVSEDGRRDTLRTGYIFYDLSTKITMRPNNRHRFSVSYYGGRDVLDVRLPFDLSLDFSSWLKPADLFFEIDHNWGNRLVSARYQYLYSRRLFLTATAYRSSYAAHEAALIRPTAASFVASDYEVRLRDLGIKLDADLYPALGHQVRAGVQAIQRGFRSQIEARVQRSPGVADSLEQASRLEAFELVAYVQDNWQPTPRLQVQPGLRASFFSGGSYGRLTPRLGLRYLLLPDRLVVRGSGAVQVQYMQRLRDRFSYLYDMVSSRWIPASAAVPPSSSFQLAAGAEVYPRPWWTVALDGYWRRSDGVLLPRDAFQTKDGLEGPGIEVGTLLGQYLRGQARAYGLELSTRIERESWQVWVSYAGGRSLNRAPDEPDFRPARFDVPRSLRGAISRQGRHWGVSLGLDWRSGYPITVPEARYALGDPLADEPTRYLYRPTLNNGRLPPYLRVDLLVGYRFRIAGVRFLTQLNLYNVMNRRNVIDRLDDPRQEGPVVITDRRGLPLLPLFELRMEL